jgi:site-specific DNA recombinase
MGRPRKPRPGAARGQRALVYLRVSTEEQGKPGHFGLPAQEEQCRKHAAQRGYTILAVLTDSGISGTTPIEARPALAEALTRCERGGADVIVVAAQDRLARKAAVFDAIRDRAVKGHYRLESAKDGQDVAQRENQIPAHIQSFIASFERILIVQRLLGGRQQRSRLDGLGSGPLPYGYVRLADGSLGIDEEAAPVIRQVLRWKQQDTYQATAERLNAAGYRTAKGHAWTPGHVYKIERHRDLYETGWREWDGLVASIQWPVLVEAVPRSA